MHFISSHWLSLSPPRDNRWEDSTHSIFSRLYSLTFHTSDSLSTWVIWNWHTYTRQAIVCDETQHFTKRSSLSPSGTKQLHFIHQQSNQQVYLCNLIDCLQLKIHTNSSESVEENLKCSKQVAWIICFEWRRVSRREHVSKMMKWIERVNSIYLEYRWQEKKEPSLRSSTATVF